MRAGTHGLEHRSMVVVAALLAASSAWANGFRNPPETAEALGRDGGKMTAIQDASAMAGNPANMAELPRPEAIVSLTLVHTETDYDSAIGSATTDDPWKFLPNAFLAFPIDPGTLSAGVALTTPFGQSTVWEKDSVLRYSVPYHAELRVLNINPSVAARVNERVSVGLGFNVYNSELKLRQFLPWSAVVGNPAAPDGLMKFDGDGTGVGWNLGVQVKLTERQSIGATYRSAVEVDYEGDFRVSNIPDPTLAAPKSDFESEIEFPSIAAVGYGIQVNERLHVGVDVEWIEFSTFQQLPLDIGVNNALLPLPGVPQLWDDTWTYGVGAEYRLNDAWVVRGGYKFMETPIPDATLAPTLPDADRHLLTAGLGYQKGDHRLDLAYAYSIFDDRTTAGNPDPAFNGSYDISSHLFVITYGVQL